MVLEKKKKRYNGLGSVTQQGLVVGDITIIMMHIFLLGYLLLRPALDINVYTLMNFLSCCILPTLHTERKSKYPPFYFCRIYHANMPKSLNH
jgi:hypothetical protein